MIRYKALLSAALLLGTYACASQAIPPTPVSEEAVVPTSPGKPSAPASIQFIASSNRNRLGVPQTVRTVITPTADVDSLEVSFGLTDGLAAAGELPVLRLGAQKAGIAYSQDLIVSPRREGQHFLSVFVTTRQGAQQMGKSASYPISVGAPGVKSLPVQTDASGRSVIPMPASEPPR